MKKSLMKFIKMYINKNSLKIIEYVCKHNKTKKMFKILKVEQYKKKGREHNKYKNKLRIINLILIIIGNNELTLMDNKNYKKLINIKK